MGSGTLSTATPAGTATLADRARPAGTILAVDGGNSKTDVLLATDTGQVLAQAQAGPFTPQSSGVSTAVDAVAKAVGEIRTALGLPEGVPLAQHLSAFVAGADLPQEEEALAEAFAARGWTETVEVGNDSFALLRAGASRSWGVAVVCGAGINCVGIGPDGRRARYPAIGELTGDWGGGSALGRMALWAAVRGEDGRGPLTELSTAVAEHFGTPTALDVALGIHLGAIPEERIHELSPLLLRVAAQGDPTALEFVQRQAVEIVVWARVALERLDLLDQDAEVVLGGGVLRAAEPVLMDRVFALAAEQIPAARLVVPSHRPVHGALLLGLDRLGLTADG
ncbi:N-acetylglucosamine kinase [Actinospica robiniae]|uniref:N-acetylglucosamine kinase n=1 Tax=Actinospica robiniae TaxID=304901 RepID=UPI0003F6F327|nr:BadF/BadG/BcrA/BcrD ATPase family protein [Actinospica robiniae]